MSEFSHYEGCRMRDPDNCSGCALTTGGPEGPNYAGWPLCYIESGRSIPIKWKNALEKQRNSDNRLYALNIEKHLWLYDVRFSDGTKVERKSTEELERMEKELQNGTKNR